MLIISLYTLLIKSRITKKYYLMLQAEQELAENELHDQSLLLRNRFSFRRLVMNCQEYLMTLFLKWMVNDTNMWHRIAL